MNTVDQVVFRGEFQLALGCIGGSGVARWWLVELTEGLLVGRFNEALIADC
jgi:hypothetical protein